MNESIVSLIARARVKVKLTRVVFGASNSPSIATISTAGVALVLNTLPPSAFPLLMFVPLLIVMRTIPARAVHRAPWSSVI